MDTHTGVIAFSIVAGGISAIGTIWQFVIGQGPNVKQIAGRLLVLIACTGAITYVLMMPAKSVKQPVTVSSDAHYQKAKQFFNLHNRPNAEKEARQAVFLEPTHKEAHKLLGACYGIDKISMQRQRNIKKLSALIPTMPKRNLASECLSKVLGTSPKQNKHTTMLCWTHKALKVSVILRILGFAY